jgi:hypothetical protein
MCLIRTLQHWRHGALLCALAALPSTAAANAALADTTQAMTPVWISAAAYGLTLLSAFNNKQR